MTERTSSPAARAHAEGDEARSIIAGYHWFTDWGRDTKISLEGLTLVTGRVREAGYILRTFAAHVRNGLIPNFIPDRSNEGVYHTADATLWFFQALHRYLEATGDRTTLRLLMPKRVPFTCASMLVRRRGSSSARIVRSPVASTYRSTAWKNQSVASAVW